MNCVFCDKKEIRDRAVYKDELVFVFPTNIPITPGHLLVCPTRHITNWHEATQAERDAISEQIGRFQKALTKAFDAKGFNMAWNQGEVAGQAVPHLHIHIVPRKAGDTGIYEYEPRKFLYRPRSRAKSPEKELIEVADLIRRVL